MRSKGEWGLEDWAMEEKDGFSVGIGGMTQEEDISVVALAAQDSRARRGGDSQAVGTEGHFTVVADADPGLETPDVRPPGAGWGGAQDGAVVG